MLVEAVVVIPAFIFLLFACAQLFIISWRMSQVQFQASELARTLAIPVGNAYPCAAVRATAVAFGQQSLGVTPNNPVTIEVMQGNAGVYAPVVPAGNCPAANFLSTNRQTAVLTLNYQVPLFFGQLLPGGVNFNYRGVAVAVLEKPTG